MRETYAQSSGKLDSLRAILNKLPPEGRTFGSDTMRVRVLCRLSFLVGLTNPDSSYKLAQSALILSQKLASNKLIALSNHQFGYSHLFIGKNLQAIEFFFKSLSISEKLKLDSLTGVNLRQIGNAYFELKQYSNAVTYYLRAMPFLSKVGYHKGYANCLNDIGNSLFFQKKYKESIEYFKRCILYGKKYNLPIMINYSTWSIANSYLEEKNYTMALKYAKKGLYLNKVSEDIIPYDWIMGYNTIAKIYLGMNNINKAIYYSNKSINDYKINSGNYNAQIYKTQYEIHKQLRDYKKALFFFEKHKKINETSKEQDFKKQLRNITFEYQNTKQNEQIIALKTKQAKDKEIRFILFSSLSILVILLSIFWRNNHILKKKNIQIKNQKKEIESIKNELQHLNINLEEKVKQRTLDLSLLNKELIIKNKEIMNALSKGQSLERKRVASELHDNLGGTLTAIKWQLATLDFEVFTQKEKKIYDTIMEMIQNAYNDVRLLSHNLLPSELESRGLRGALEKFISDINRSKNIAVELFLDKNLEYIGETVSLELYSILMELMSNVLKHSKATQACINISIFDKERTIKVEVIDNGIGVDTTVIHKGMGFKNLKERVKNINGNISIQSSKSTGTTVNFEANY